MQRLGLPSTAVIDPPGAPCGVWQLIQLMPLGMSCGGSVAKAASDRINKGIARNKARVICCGLMSPLPRK